MCGFANEIFKISIFLSINYFCSALFEVGSVSFQSQIMFKNLIFSHKYLFAGETFGEFCPCSICLILVDLFIKFNPWVVHRPRGPLRVKNRFCFLTISLKWLISQFFDLFGFNKALSGLEKLGELEKLKLEKPLRASISWLWIDASPHS